MKNKLPRFVCLSVLFMLAFSLQSFAQDPVTVTGRVTDGETGEPLVGVNILRQGTFNGTITNLDGRFKLEVNAQPPFTLLFSSVGYQRKEIVVNSTGEADNLDVTLNESYILRDEVVVSASRVEENILESPVTIEKMGILDIRQTAADNYYKAIGNLKGVDVSSSSINFQIINARGFNSTGNTRFVQLIDGMDTQAPALNFPIGNLNGPSELDVESVELIPGASSALYGPNAFNGVLLINSKSPFMYQGLSAMAKLGVNHIGNTGADPSPMYEGSIRYAKAFNNKVAFKVNFSYSQGEDWHGTNFDDVATQRQPANFSFNPGADLVHAYGDAAAVPLPLVGFSIENTIRQMGLGDYIGDIPNTVVSRTPYEEKYLVDYGAENFKANAALHYRVTDRLEAIYNFNYGYGTSVYTGANRYSLNKFNISQHKLELRGTNYFIRGYTTQERSGDSYIADFSALLINREWALANAGLLNPDSGEPAPGVNLSQGDGIWFGTYTLNYLGYLAGNGIAPGAANAQQQMAAHQAARNAADAGRYAPGSPEFNRAKERYQGNVIPNGSKFDDATNLYHAEGQYDFAEDIDFVDLQVGGSYRLFELNSNGTIFADSAGNDITISEYGAYVQASKKVLDDRLKLIGSVRYDKNENFEGQFNPRIAAVVTVAENHNFRLSYQTGFRIPATQAQHINLNVGAFRIIGGLPQYAAAYNAYDNAYNLDAVNEFIAAVAEAGTSSAVLNPALLQKLEQGRVLSLNPVMPERVRSYEVGYKSLIGNKLDFDLVYYYNQYEDFIAQTMVRKAAGDISVNPINALTLLSGNQDNTFAINTNIDRKVSSQGMALGLNYGLPKGYNIGGNYNWNKFNADFGEGFLNDFNTPEHKVNLSFGNRKLLDNLGFNITWRWQDDFMWESSFAVGRVESFRTVDAQISYKFDTLKSVLKIGGSNIFNNIYTFNYGGPSIGSIFYVSLTYDELLN